MWRRGPWGGRHHSGEPPVSAVKKVLAGRWDRNLCFNIPLCGCVSVRVWNDCRQGLRAGPLSLFSAHPCSQRRPLPGGPALPRAPRLAGVSLWYDADTLVCQGRGGGPRSSHHLCSAKRKMAMGPQSCGWGWRDTPLPGITTTVTGVRGDRPGLRSDREDQRVAGRQAVGGPLLCPLSLGTEDGHNAHRHICQHGPEVVCCGGQLSLAGSKS